MDAMMDELTEALSRLPRFSLLSTEELAPLAKRFALAEHAPGHVFVREGHRANGAFLILSGEVAVSRRREGVVDELGRLGPGAMFGLVALLDDERRAATCTAISPVKSGWLSNEEYGALLKESSPVAFALQRLIADQLCADFRRLQADLRKELNAQG